MQYLYHVRPTSFRVFRLPAVASEARRRVGRFFYFPIILIISFMK